jgi:hypothetical protein
MKILFILLVVILIGFYLFTTHEKFDYTIQIDKYTGYATTHKSEFDFPLPPGSWRENCDLINWKHPFLSARCYDDKKHPHNNIINIHTCVDKNVHVHNGHLDCH